MLCTVPIVHAKWVPVATNTSASFRGVHVAGKSVWVSGTDGTILRSPDNGSSWSHCAVPPGATKLDFRSVWAFDEKSAFVLSSGPGELSRLFRTSDGCNSWTLVIENKDGSGFWDGILFTSAREGFILGDPVKGQFVLLRSFDDGIHWTEQINPLLSAEPAGEGAFAASNSSLAIAPGTNFLYFATGGFGGARVRRIPMEGGVQTLAAIPVPVGSALDSAGVFSLAFRDAQHGIAVGGDFRKPQEGARTAAWTDDGGEHWHSPDTPPAGYRSAVAWDKEARQWIAVGPTGTDVSHDDGQHWTHVDDAGWNALSLPWVVGSKGHIARWETTRTKR